MHKLLFASSSAPAGMQAFFRIFICHPNAHKKSSVSKLREYFIAAQEQVWNYAPNIPEERFVIPDIHWEIHTSVRNNVYFSEEILCDCDFCVLSEAQIFVSNGPNRIGSSYKKVRYVGYTDSSFRKKIHHDTQDHLGILGNTNLAKVLHTFLLTCFNNRFISLSELICNFTFLVPLLSFTTSSSLAFSYLHFTFV